MLLMADRSSVNQKPGTKTLQIWRNQAGVLHVGRNDWEAMIVYADGKLIALDKREKVWVQRRLTAQEWARVKTELESDKRRTS